MRLHPMTCGRISIPAEYLWPGAGVSEPVWASVGMFALEHPKGLLLFDTGSAPEVAVDAAAHWGAEVAAQFPCELSAEDTIDRQLARRGLDPAAVRFVVMSHLHLDHAGGMKLFPKARFLIGLRELVDAAWPRPGFDEGCYLAADLLPARRFDIVPVERDLDVFDDGTVRVLQTPGHSTGHLSLLVDLPHAGRILLPGDACFNRTALDEALAPGDPLPAPWRASFERVRDLVREGATPLWSHVPWDELPASPNARPVYE